MAASPLVLPAWLQVCTDVTEAFFKFFGWERFEAPPLQEAAAFAESAHTSSGHDSDPSVSPVLPQLCAFAKFDFASSANCRTGAKSSGSTGKA